MFHKGCFSLDLESVKGERRARDINNERERDETRTCVFMF